MTGLTNSASGGDPHAPGLGELAATIAPEPARQLLPDSVLPDKVQPDSVPVDPEPQPDWNEWRSEVAARLARYRTRRKPRAPRYPSLLLPFDSHGNWSRSSVAPYAAVRDTWEPTTNGVAHEDANSSAIPYVDHDEPQLAQPAARPIVPPSRPQPDFFAEPSAKIIEFPRSAAIPIVQSSALADPIVDRPRIVEAPEIVPLLPALGGILIEPALVELPARSAAAEPLVPSASIAQRLLAVSVDVLILLAALATFSAIFLRLNPIHEPLPVLAAAGFGLGLFLWMAYQFLFIVGTGSTPGLRAARLSLTKFDGSPVPRRTRRWRVLASLLSGFSAGLGYLWCFLDQDSLCWHDRITRTHIQSTRQ